ncbi:heat shock protein HspQ [Brevundimonas bullata]|jgi:heat shock protein HspQ|uniref:Heat shock protein HspQ n=1 Tax=Brevundimonas bullata TaxID=13160 RepID=A0A7W7IRB9_9CAUL|nr:heat shock protein HspQ [Brevundimonas bullata]MBB4799101.1 heat shock protein HspQ [Brevundimonas bullata]MBB6384204.1 heat shock protein HspQ [Brevundimonas bullata]
MTQVNIARFGLGQIVRHRDHAFHGLVMDVDASYAGPAEETGAVASDQPFYRILVADAEGGLIAYAAEDALVATPEIEPLSLDDERQWFTIDAHGRHAPRSQTLQ